MAGMELVKKLREASGAGILACQKALKEANDDFDKAFEILRKQGVAKASSKADREANEGLVCYAENGNSYVIIKLSCETDFVAKNENFQKLLEKITNTALSNKAKTNDDLLNCNVDGKTIKDLITEGIASIGENLVLSGVVYRELASNQTAVFYVHNKAEGQEKMGRIITTTIAEGANGDDAKTLLKNIDMHITAMSPLGLNEESVDADVVAKEKAIYEEQVAELNKPENIAQKMIEGKLRKFFEECVLLNQMFVLDNKNSVKNVIENFNKEHKAELKLISFDRVSIQ